MRTGGGFSYRQPNVAGCSQLVGIEYLGSTVCDRISRGLLRPAKPAGEDVTVVIQGSEGFPEVETAYRQRS